LAELPEYNRIRKNIMQFLKNCAQEMSQDGRPKAADAVVVGQELSAET